MFAYVEFHDFPFCRASVKILAYVEFHDLPFCRASVKILAYVEFHDLPFCRVSVKILAFLNTDHVVVGSILRTSMNFKCGLGLERGPRSLVRTID